MTVIKTTQQQLCNRYHSCNDEPMEDVDMQDVDQSGQSVQDGIIKLERIAGSPQEFKKHIENWIQKYDHVFMQVSNNKDMDLMRKKAEYSAELLFPSVKPCTILENLTDFDIERARIMLVRGNSNIKKGQKDVNFKYSVARMIARISNAKSALKNFINATKKS